MNSIPLKHWDDVIVLLQVYAAVKLPRLLELSLPDAVRLEVVKNKYRRKISRSMRTDGSALEIDVTTRNREESDLELEDQFELKQLMLCGAAAQVTATQQAVVVRNFCESRCIPAFGSTVSFVKVTNNDTFKLEAIRPHFMHLKLVQFSSSSNDIKKFVRKNVEGGMLKYIAEVDSEIDEELFDIFMNFFVAGKAVRVELGDAMVKKNYSVVEKIISAWKKDAIELGEKEWFCKINKHYAKHLKETFKLAKQGSKDFVKEFIAGDHKCTLIVDNFRVIVSIKTTRRDDMFPDLL
ncbi:hypothetical protein QR680_010716 [Steinernema hermaphroditum]|uniref:Uncharacterized protein n=1 Tax=Steinernema hermaphroditum TaxID=289476 RepID=A0AA39MB58_9BILA|nr:hypothetical protein QR680_010716 [Steinernema hermaphroditum]